LHWFEANAAAEARFLLLATLLR